MRNVIVLGCAALWLCGCATAISTYGPDGKAAYSIQCSGSELAWGDCERKAGDVCKSAGYTVLSKSSDGKVTVGGTTQGFYGAATQSRTMLIQCGRATETQPQ